MKRLTAMFLTLLLLLTTQTVAIPKRKNPL